MSFQNYEAVFRFDNIIPTDADKSAISKAMEELTKLESRVCKVLTTIRDAQCQNKPSATISYEGYMDLRKYMVIHQTQAYNFSACYQSDISEYGKELHGQIKDMFRKTSSETMVQLWAHHIQVIIRTPFDAAGSWKRTLKANLMRTEYERYISGIDEYYLAFATPEDRSCEFLLTEQGLDVSESAIIEDGQGDFTNVHFASFATITPRLLLITRATLLKDTVQERKLLALVRQAGSTVEGLTIAPESVLENMTLPEPKVPRVIKSGSRVQFNSDVVTLPLSKARADHVMMVNAVVLSSTLEKVIYSSPTSLATSLESWNALDSLQIHNTDVRHRDLMAAKLSLLKLWHELDPTGKHEPPADASDSCGAQMQDHDALGKSYHLSTSIQALTDSSARTRRIFG
jgi:hypothetical protein